MDVRGQLLTPAALSLEKASTPRSERDYVGPKASFDVLAKRRLFSW
jgi:hypothetical protein